MQRVRCPIFSMLDAACNKRTPGAGCSALDGVNEGRTVLGTSEKRVATHRSDHAVALVALDGTSAFAGLAENPTSRSLTFTGFPEPRRIWSTRCGPVS